MSQTEAQITYFLRVEGGGWSFEEKTSAADSIRLKSVDCVISVSEVYEGVTFSSVK